MDTGTDRLSDTVRDPGEGQRYASYNHTTIANVAQHGFVGNMGLLGRHSMYLFLMDCVLSLDLDCALGGERL